MELAAAATIWAMFASFLIFPLLGLPAVLHRTAMALLTAELLALGMHSYGSPPVAAAGRSVATFDVPLLAAALIALVIIRGVRVQRRR